jgi:hypothetical protein
MSATTMTPSVTKLMLDKVVLGILKKKKEESDAAFKGHAALIATVYTATEEMVTQAFDQAIKDEAAAAEAAAKNLRIAEKQKAINTFIDGALKGVTIPKAIAEKVQAVMAKGADFTDADSTVTLGVSFAMEGEGDAKKLTLKVVQNGNQSVRASSSSTGTRDGDISESSRVSPFQAHLDGRKKGDAFVIERVDGQKGRFRDVTMNVDIPPKGLTGHLKQHYPNSEAVAILKRYGQA